MNHHSCSLSDAFRDQPLKTSGTLIGALVIIFIAVIPLLTWFKDKLVESWKTLVWASVGVGMLAMTMMATEVQEHVISIVSELYHNHTLSSVVSPGSLLSKY